MSLIALFAFRKTHGSVTSLEFGNIVILPCPVSHSLSCRWFTSEDYKTNTARKWKQPKPSLAALNWHLEIASRAEWAELISAKNYRITLKEDWWHSDSHFALPSIIQLPFVRAVPFGERCLQTFHHLPLPRWQHCARNAVGQINSGRFSGRFSFSKNSLR